MKPDEIQQLLGGYATGTLTPEEKKALFDAALEDQNLFDALAREQSLKDALDSPAVRRELMDALESKPSWRERWFRWPYQLAGAGALAAVAVTVIAIVRLTGPAPAPIVQIAQDRTAAVRERALPTPQITAPLPKRRKPRPVAAPKKAQPEPAREIPAPVALEAPPAAPPPPPAGAPEAFYAPRNRSATGGVVGGVIGGYPAAAPRAMAALAPSKLGLRYSVRTAQGGPPQLVVESNADAVLYIFRRDTLGQWFAVEAGGISVKANAPITTPGIAGDAGAPEPRAILILSRTPLTELAQSGAALSAAIERLRSEHTAAVLIPLTLP